MGILFQYIMGQYLKILALCQLGLTAVYLIVDFFEKLRKFLKYDAELFPMLAYFFFKIPDISFKLVPLSALMAILLTIGMFNKHHEITAMRSSGISFFQVTAPFFAVGVLITIILFGFTAVIIPLANNHAEYIKTVEIEKKPQPLSFTAKHLWLKIRNNTILNVEEVSPEGSLLKDIRLYQVDDTNFQLEKILDAKTAHYEGTEWTLYDAAERHLLPNGQVVVTTHQTFPLELSLAPEDFMTWISFEPEHMTLRELRIQIDHLKEEGQNIARFLTDYWGRVSSVFVTLLMTVLGIALSFTRIDTRSSNIARGIGQALAIGFLFWATHSVGITLGRNGALVPIVAGWIAWIMFFVFSLNLFLKVRY